jgi:hypothetical protein
MDKSNYHAYNLTLQISGKALMQGCAVARGGITR